MTEDPVQLCPFDDVDGQLRPRDGAHRIALNRRIEERVVDRPEDASRSLLLRVYAADYTPGPVLSVAGADLVIRTTANLTVDPELLGAVRARLDALPNDWYEIFPADHNVDAGFHFPDPWGESTTLLGQLADVLGRVPPSVNHDKVSSRRVDRYTLDEIHVDSFEGMRVTDGRRTLVWRYFVNLGDDVRWTAIVPFDPVALDVLLAVDYHPCYLDPVFRAASWRVPVLLVPTPPRTQSRAHALKLCTTHLLHSEYGDRGDLLAVINSLM